METIQIQNLSVDDLKKIIAESIEEFLINLPDQADESKEIFGTRKEVAKSLQISLPTLNSLTKSGLIPGYRLGGRILYKWSEVNDALERIESINRRAQ